VTVQWVRAQPHVFPRAGWRRIQAARPQRRQARCEAL